MADAELSLAIARRWIRLHRVSKSETNRGSKLRHTSTASTVRRPSQRLRVLTAPRLQRLSFDLLSSRQNLLGPPEVDVRRRHVVQRLVVPLVVVVVDEAARSPAPGPTGKRSSAAGSGSSSSDGSARSCPASSGGRAPRGCAPSAGFRGTGAAPRTRSTARCPRAAAGDAEPAPGRAWPCARACSSVSCTSVAAIVGVSFQARM